MNMGYIFLIASGKGLNWPSIGVHSIVPSSSPGHVTLELYHRVVKAAIKAAIKWPSDVNIR